MSRRSRSNSNSMGSRNSNGDTGKVSVKNERGSATKLHGGFHGGFHGGMNLQTDNNAKSSNGTSAENGRSLNGFHSKPKQTKEDIQQQQQQQQQKDQNQQHRGRAK
ncbi:hypothetical protein ACO0QE_002641 [Hanseniaspora vineae]